MQVVGVQVFLVGPSFQGVKLVPPGSHAITTTRVATDRPVPTVTRWMHLPARSVTVARWDADHGRFQELSDKEEVCCTSGPSPDHSQQLRARMQYLIQPLGIVYMRRSEWHEPGAGTVTRCTNCQSNKLPVNTDDQGEQSHMLRLMQVHS